MTNLRDQIMPAPGGHFREVPRKHNTNGGERFLFYWPNGWGASVIRGTHSIGGPMGLYELAVLHGPRTADPADLDDVHICSRSPVTDEPIGWCTPQRIQSLLDEIAALQPLYGCPHSSWPTMGESILGGNGS